MPKIRMIPRSHVQLKALELRVLPKDTPYCDINPKGIWWGYFNNGQLVAASSLSIWMPGWAFLARTVVAPEARGQGLQRRFTRAREKYARLKGVHTIVTYTDATNIISANNLIECGYRLYTPHEKWGLQPFSYYFKKKL